MIRKYLIVIFLWFITNAVNAQTFSKEIVNPSSLMRSEYAFSSTSDSYFVGLSEIDVSNNSRKSMLLAILNADGLIQQSYKYSTADSNYSINCWEFLQVTDNDLLVSGTYSSNGSPPYYSFIMSLDSLGNVNWAKKINVWNSSYGVKLKMLSNGSILCHFSYNDGTIHKVFFNIDVNGNLSNFYETNYTSLNWYDVIVNNNTFDLLLVDGNLLNINNNLSAINWQRKYYAEIGVTINKAANGDYLLASTQESFPGHMTVSRLDSNGTIIWSKYIKTWLNSSSFPFDIVGFHFITETPKGNILTCANSEGGSNGSLKVMLDANGNYISNYKTTSFYNKTLFDNQNKLLIGGFKSIGSINTSNFIFAKLELEDNFDCDTIYNHSITQDTQAILTPDIINLTPTTAIATENIAINKSTFSLNQTDYCDILLSLSENNKENNSVVIYPNPTKGKLTIDSKASIESISLYDINGSLLLNTKNSEIDISSFSVGQYFISIKTNESVVVKKIIKSTP